MDNSKFPDLQVTQYFDPSDKNYFNTDVKGLTADTLYGFNFQWVFEDEDLNTKYNTLWSNTFRVQTIPLPLAESTDVAATWGEDSLQITWKSPTHSTGFQIALTGNVLGVPTTVYFGHKKDLTTINQKIVITKQQIMANFGNVFQTTLSGLLKTDYINAASNGVPFAVPAYVDPLSGLAILDSSWAITPVDKGFSVSWNAIPTTGTYWETVVYQSSTPTGTYLPVGSATNAPVTVKEINTVYIKIRHRLITGGYSAYSNYKVAAAYVPIIFDETPPNEVTVNNTSWSGYDLKINYTIPAQDPGSRMRIVLKTMDNLNEATFSYSFPSSTGTHTQTISEGELSRSFNGEIYPQFTGKFISIDAGDNPTTGVNFTTVALSNPGSGQVPTFTPIGIINGYTLSWETPSWATRTEVYQNDTSGFTPGLSNKVYTGGSPATISTASNTSPFATKYIVIKHLGKLSTAESEFSLQGSVRPINPDNTDSTPPPPVTSTGVGSSNLEDPSGISGIITLTVSNPTMPSDFRGYSVKIVSGSITPITTYEDFTTLTPLSTLTIRNGIYVGQSYTVSVATKDIQNLQSYVNATPNPIVVSDSRSNISVATNLTVSATDSIATASWTAPNNNKVGSYKVMITSNADTDFASPTQTIFTDSTQTSFGGLTAATAYRIRVTTRYSNNGALSTQNTDLAFTLNASGSISDGNVPTKNPGTGTEPAIVVKSLFKAFTLTWSEIPNADDVTYEVYVKTVNNTGIVDPANLVMEINGTFAVINSLKDGTAIAYPAETSPTTATDYYFAVRAKDADGISSATVTPIGPFTASRTGRFDIATDSIHANHIRVNEITAEKMITDLLFVDKTINVGQSTSLNRIRLDSNTIAAGSAGYSNPTEAIKSRMFIGSGTYNNSGTPFYADNLGRFSLKDKLLFDGANLQIDANGSFGGLLTAGTSGQAIKIGLNAGGTNLHGIYIEANTDYIYSNGNFKLGAGKLQYPVDGNLKITANVDIVGSSMLTGDLGVTGVGSTIFAGDSKSIGNRVVMNKTGLFGYNGEAINFSFPNDTGLFKLGTGNISGWTVDSGKIEKTNDATNFVGISTASGAAFYAGASAGGTGNPKFLVTHAGKLTARSINIFADSTLGAENKLIDAGAFFVRQDGFLKATSAEIEGKISAGSGTFTGTVDIGTAALPAGQLRIAATGGTILVGHGVTIDGVTAAGITATNTDGTKNFWVRATDGYLFSQSGKIGGWDIGTSKLSGGADTSGVGLQIVAAGGYAFWAGSATPSINTAFSVTNTGILKATNAIISGTINATTGYIGSDTTGWTFNSTSITSRTPSGKTPIVLDGLNATISGGTISGSAITGGSITGTTVTSNATSGKGKVQLDGTNSRILFNSDQTGFSFSLDSDTSTVTSYSYSSVTDTGADAGDGNTYYNTYYNTWFPVPKAVAYNEAISLKRTDSNDATLNNPKLTLAIGNASYESFLRISNQGSGPTVAAFSSITLQKGGVIINTNRGALKIENMIDTSVSPAYGAHYAHTSANNYRTTGGTYLTGGRYEVGVPLLIKSDGSVSTGRAIFKTSASEATITSTSGSLNPYMYMGLDGDIMFSTSS